MKGIFSERSLDTILRVSGQLDKAAQALDELPESGHLSHEIEALTTIVDQLEAIIRDEEF